MERLLRGAGQLSVPVRQVDYALLASVPTAASVFGVLVPLWRRVLTPARSGMTASFSIQLPALLAVLVVATLNVATTKAAGLVGRGFLELLVKTVLLGALYAELARLVDGPLGGKHPSWPGWCSRASRPPRGPLAPSSS